MDHSLKNSQRDRPGAFFPKERIAVALLFLLNGIVIGAWATQIPDLVARLQIAESALGLLLVVFGIGSLITMPLAGAQIARFGSSLLVKISTLLFVPALLLLSLAGNVWTATAAIFLFGGVTGAMDVAMNANAVAVEKSMRRAIMSSCHAFWSLGGLLGSATGGFLIVWLGAVGHAALLTLLLALLLFVAWPMVIADRPQRQETIGRSKLPMTPLPWLVGVIALFSMIPEGAVLDWGALYLRNELGASQSLSGFAFAAFSLTMALMRFAGDFIRDRFGAVRTLRMSTLIAMAGLIMAGLAPNEIAAMIGFAISGIGISNMVPIIFSTAGNLPGLPNGIGLSVVTTLGYSGILFAPSLIGFVAEHTGLAVIFLAVPLLHIVVLALSHLAVHADGTGRE